MNLFNMTSVATNENFLNECGIVIFPFTVAIEGFKSIKV